jgi:hypothetical protein
MKLITKDIEKKMLPLYAGEEKHPRDIKVVAKFFTSWSNWTWYITEADLTTGRMFGLCVGHEAELGYVSLQELQSLRGPGGLKVERDKWWEGTLLDAMKEHGYDYSIFNGRL